MRARVSLSLLAAVLGGVLVWCYYTRYAPGTWSDFDQIWFGARVLLTGNDPYVVLPKYFPWPFYYPLPAALVGIPFAPLSILSARIAFAALTAGVATWAILRHRPQSWPLLLSAPFLYGLVRGQWAPLLVAGALIPWIGTLMAVKPTIGLATFAYRPNGDALAGAAMLGFVSFLLQPSWPGAWLATSRNAPHLIIPILEPGSIMLLAALVRWRAPGARVLVLLACVPQTPSIYELFPLALVPTTVRQSLGVALGWNVLYILTLATHNSTPLTMADLAHHRSTINWPLTLCLGYLPALVCVLWPLIGDRHARA